MATAVSRSAAASGGKERLGRITKMGDRAIRRRLVAGALSVIRWDRPKAGFAERRIGRLVGRKPLKLAAVALANKMAQIIWAVLTGGERFVVPVSDRLSLADVAT